MISDFIKNIASAERHRHNIEMTSIFVKAAENEAIVSRCCIWLVRTAEAWEELTDDYEGIVRCLTKLIDLDPEYRWCYHDTDAFRDQCFNRVYNLAIALQVGGHVEEAKKVHFSLLSHCVEGALSALMRILVGELPQIQDMVGMSKIREEFKQVATKCRNCRSQRWLNNVTEELTTLKRKLSALGCDREANEIKMLLSRSEDLSAIMDLASEQILEISFSSNLPKTCNQIEILDRLEWCVNKAIRVGDKSSAISAIELALRSGFMTNDKSDHFYVFFTECASRLEMQRTPIEGRKTNFGASGNDGRYYDGDMRHSHDAYRELGKAGSPSLEDSFGDESNQPDWTDPLT